MSALARLKSAHADHRPWSHLKRCLLTEADAKELLAQVKNRHSRIALVIALENPNPDTITVLEDDRDRIVKELAP